MSNTSLSIGNLSVEEVYSTVTQKGLTSSQANAFVGEWLLINSGKAKRVFSYGQAFNAVEEACKSSFVRSFAHNDWIDGESVVQASETPEELGFNQRFHRLESDIDSLGSNLALGFTCMANLRGQLKSLLEEIRVEINRINAQLDDTSSNPPLTINSGLVQQGAFLGKFKINDKNMQLWHTPSGMLMLPDLETVAAPIWNDPRAQRAATYSRYIEENPQVRATFP
jgi:hypothetical protein